MADEPASATDMNAPLHEIDRIERLVGLEADGELDEERRRELAALEARRPAEVERARRELRHLRRMMRADRVPPAPAGQRDRILRRVRAAQAEDRAERSLLPFVRLVTAAAAALLLLAAWPAVVGGRAVRADERSLLDRRGVEDELRALERDGGVDLVRFLERRLLGRGD